MRFARFQFSLRQFVIAVTLFCTYVGCWSQTHESGRMAFAKDEDFGFVKSPIPFLIVAREYSPVFDEYQEIHCDSLAMSAQQARGAGISRGSVYEQIQDEQGGWRTSKREFPKLITHHYFVWFLGRIFPTCYSTTEKWKLKKIVHATPIESVSSPTHSRWRKWLD